MKRIILRKLLWLPLIALLLNGCAVGKKVTPDIAHSRIEEALTNERNTAQDTFEQKVVIDVHNINNEYHMFGNDFDKVKTTILIKGQDLNTDRKKFKMNVDMDLRILKDVRKMIDIIGTEKVYYVDDYLYENFRYKYRRAADFFTKEHVKYKSNVGKIYFAPGEKLASYINSNLLPGVIPTQIDYNAMLQYIERRPENVIARELAGILTIKFSLSEEDYIRDQAIQSLGHLDYYNMTDEEKALVENQIQAKIEEIRDKYSLKKYQFMIQIGQDSFIRKTVLERNLSHTYKVCGACSETTKTIRDKVEIITKINKNVIIIFPPFYGYLQIAPS